MLRIISRNSFTTPRSTTATATAAATRISSFFGERNHIPSISCANVTTLPISPTTTTTFMICIRSFASSSSSLSMSSLSSSSFSISQSKHERPNRRRRNRLDVAIVGAPNAGKSQLLNALTQSTISAVSRKRHTTRSDVLGARTLYYNDNDNETSEQNENQQQDNNNSNIPTQIVFKDTPGFLKLENAKEERLDRDLIVTAAAELVMVDYSLLVVDAARKLTETYAIALEELMKGALNSRGRFEEEEEEIFDDDDDDDNDIRNNNNKENFVSNVTNNTTSTTTTTPNTRRHNYGAAKFAIVLNKIDLVKNKTELVDLAMEIGSIADKCLVEKYGIDLEKDVDILMDIAPIVFYVSALKDKENGNAIEDLLLRQHLVELATPCTSWPVEPGQTTSLTPVEQVEELIREKLYRCLHREVPHNIRQENRLFRIIGGGSSSSSGSRDSNGISGNKNTITTPKGMIIHQDLIVFSNSHKRLVMGSGGKTLQRIQDTATRDLQALFGCEVVLRLHVAMKKSKNIRRADEYDR